MNSSFLKPIRPIDISHTIISIPSSPAVLNISSSERTLFFFIRCLIITGPIPSIFMFESLRAFLPFGSIIPNIFEIKFLPLALFFSSLSALSAQKEKNIFTFVSIAAAAIPIIIEAITLSRSPDTTAIESWSFLAFSSLSTLFFSLSSCSCISLNLDCLYPFTKKAHLAMQAGQTPMI